MRRTSRQAPGVDGLVVVADHEQVPFRLGKEGDELELGRVDVLELVHQDVAEASLPLPARGRVPTEPAQRVRQQPVEVDLIPGLEEPEVGIDHVGQGGRGRSPFEDRGCDHTVQRLGLWQSLPAEGVQHLAACPPQKREAVGHQPRRSRPVEHDAASEGVEGPHLRSIPARHESQSGGDALAQLAGGVPVEGDSQDPGPRNPTGDEHADAGDQGRRLAAAGRGDDLRRSRTEGRGFALPFVETGEKVGCGRHGQEGGATPLAGDQPAITRRCTRRGTRAGILPPPNRRSRAAG